MTLEEVDKLLEFPEKRRLEYKGRVNFKEFKEHLTITLVITLKRPLKEL
jgi:hypothetical protein